jgi:hypothetical protein
MVNRKESEKFFYHTYMTIHTAIEIPCRVEKKNAVYFSIIRPKNAKKRVKMP